MIRTNPCRKCGCPGAEWMTAVWSHVHAKPKSVITYWCDRCKEEYRAGLKRALGRELPGTWTRLS